MAENELISQEKEFETTDQGFAAYLATKFMFLGAIDTGKRSSNGQYTRKAFVFLVPDTEDMDKHMVEYSEGVDNTRVPAFVMFQKMRLMRQACQKPFNHGAKA